MSAGRRLRAVLVTSCIWGLAWIPVGLVVALRDWSALTAHLSMPWSWPPLEALTPAVAGRAVWGAITGAVFAGLLIARARSRTLDDLSVRGVALGGALAALAFPGGVIGGIWAAEGFQSMTLAPAIPSLLFGAVFGAGLAAGTLALARRGTAIGAPDDREVELREAAT